MLFSPLSATILLLCLSSTHTTSFAAPGSGSSVAGQTMFLKKRVPSSPKSIDDWGVWARQHREGLQAKYGVINPLQKRAGNNL